MKDKFLIYLGHKGQTRLIKIGEKPQDSPKIYVNPIKEAKNIKMLVDLMGSQAAVARKLKVTRARVTQMLNLLQLPDEVLETMLELEPTDNLLSSITERSLRRLLKYEPDEQVTGFFSMLSRG